MSSAILQGIDFSFAHLRGLDLSRDVTGPVMGNRSTVEGDVILTGGNYGSTSLFRIEIDGSLDCSAGTVPGGDSPLSMIEATIRGAASFHQGFTTNGVVDLRLAQIGRGLSFNHARFIGSGENGLTAERSTINETLYWVRYRPYPAHKARPHQRARRVAVGRSFELAGVRATPRQRLRLRRH
jgi:hypothetical protein